MFTPSPPFLQRPWQPLPPTPLRVRQAFGRGSGSCSFPGTPLPRLRIPIASMSEPSLNWPGTFRFPDLLRGGNAAASRFHTPELAERYRQQAHGWMRPCCPAIWIPPPETLRFRFGPDGKPRLAHGSLHFNLAHSDSLALLAVRQDAPVGVDVEPVRPLPEAMLIACRWFSAPEIRWIAASDDRDRAFLRCWVCREAFLKATGEGLGRPLDSFALHPCGDTLRLDGAALAECTLQATSPPWPAKPFFLHADTRRFHAVHVFTEIRHRPRRPARRPASSSWPRAGRSPAGMWRSRRIR